VSELKFDVLSTAAISDNRPGLSPYNQMLYLIQKCAWMIISNVENINIK
jgi:hypothetical protein